MPGVHKSLHPTAQCRSLRSQHFARRVRPTFIGATRRWTGASCSQYRVLGATRRRTLIGASPLRGDFVVPYSRTRRPPTIRGTWQLPGRAAAPLRAGWRSTRAR